MVSTMKIVLFFMVLFGAITAQGQTDSAVEVQSGIATIFDNNGHLDTVQWPQFVRIEPVSIIGQDYPAVVLIVTQERSDFNSYVTLRYTLVSERWSQVQTGTFTLRGSSYTHYVSLSEWGRMGYAYWKIVQKHSLIIETQE